MTLTIDGYCDHFLCRCVRGMRMLFVICRSPDHSNRGEDCASSEGISKSMPKYVALMLG